jgi:hypothetical protein
MKKLLERKFNDNTIHILYQVNDFNYIHKINDKKINFKSTRIIEALKIFNKYIQERHSIESEVR